MIKREKDLIELIRESDLEHINEQLRDAPTLVDFKDPMGLVPLHHCVMTGHNEIADLFISKGAKPDIFSAAGLGLYNQVDSILKKSPYLIDRSDNMGLTPLHWAALGGQLKVLELLLGCGSNINAKDSTGATPLHYAAMKGHRQVAEVLLYHGADPSITDDSGVWPGLRAVKEGHRELAKLLKCHLDDTMSAKFCLILSAVFCALEAALSAAFLWKVHDKTAITSSPYMFVAALAFFAVAWIGFSIGLYARLSSSKKCHKSIILSFIMFLGALLGSLAVMAGLISLVFAFRAVL